MSSQTQLPDGRQNTELRQKVQSITDRIRNYGVQMGVDTVGTRVLINKDQLSPTKGDEAILALIDTAVYEARLDELSQSDSPQEWKQYRRAELEAARTKKGDTL